MKRKNLSLAIGCALAASAMVSPLALAQEAAPAAATAQATDARTLDTITVTARRREEWIQEVPVAISAFGEKSLQALQATNIDGLQGAVPNMNIVQGRGSANSLNVFIRGIGQPDALQTFDPGVGMYVDDVYYSRINGALFSLFDVGQVEVLRGPQGTLYGKNSTGGAIKLTTKDPFGDPGGAVEFTVGNFDRFESRFYVGGELTDTIAASVAGALLTNGGYVEDPDSNRNFNDDDTKALRAKFAFRPSDTFEGTLTFDYTKQDAALTMGRPTAPLTASDLVLGTVVLAPAPTGEYDFKSRTSFEPGLGQKMAHKGVALNMAWDLGEAWRLKSISSWRKLDTASYIDIDASALELGDVFVGVDQTQYSQELQLQYDNGGAVHAIFGAYYQNEKVPSHQEAYADDFIRFIGLPIDFLRTIDDDLETTSTAVFGHFDWDFADTWTLSAGVRYSKDEKDYFRTTSAFFGAPLAAFSADPQAVANASQSWSAVTPSVALRKAFSDNVMGYVSANRGFKSGGFNGRANTQAESDNPQFDPEYVWTYEGGLKMQSADRRFTANVAAFHSEYKDFQARVSEVLESGGIPSFNFPVLNAAKMSVNGIEFEGLAQLTPDTLLSAQLGWMDASYDEFNDLRVTDSSRPDYNPHLHDHVPFSPEFTARVALQHTFDLGNYGALTLGGDVSHRSETWLSVDNRPNLSQDAYAVAGLFSTWDSPEDRWQLRAGVRNLTDEVYMTEGQEFSSVGNIQTAYFGMPRNWQVSLRFNFL